MKRRAKKVLMEPYAVDVADATCEVRFGIRAPDLDPAVVSRELGLTATSSHSRGDFVPAHSTHRAPHGVWSLVSSGLTPSHEAADHVLSLLALLEPRSAAIARYRVRPETYVAFWIKWITHDVVGGYTLSHELLSRMIALAQDVNMTFDYRRRSSPSQRDPTHRSENDRSPDAN